MRCKQGVVCFPIPIKRDVPFKQGILIFDTQWRTRRWCRTRSRRCPRRLAGKTAPCNKIMAPGWAPRIQGRSLRTAQTVKWKKSPTFKIKPPCKTQHRGAKAMYNNPDSCCLFNTHRQLNRQFIQWVLWRRVKLIVGGDYRKQVKFSSCLGLGLVQMRWCCLLRHCCICVCDAACYDTVVYVYVGNCYAWSLD